jgi:hypothetical protein
MSVISVPTSNVSRGPLNQDNLLTLYNLSFTTNNLLPYSPLSGSIFNTIKCVGNTFTAYIFLKSGSATSMGNSGSKYYIDWSPDNITWVGTGSNTGYTGSVSSMVLWNAIQFTGSAPYWRIVLVNTSGSAISGSIVVLGR